MGVRQVERKESARHRKFVRGRECIAKGRVGHVHCVDCYGPIQFCHVRSGLPDGEQAGVSEKPHDCFGFPGCATHHAQQHVVGEQSFEKMYGINLLETALALSRISPDPMVKEKARLLDQGYTGPYIPGDDDGN